MRTSTAFSLGVREGWGYDPFRGQPVDRCVIAASVLPRF
jgi:hypothetical protein